MIKYKFLKEIYDPRYFELPPTSFKSKLACYSLGYSKNKIENFNPYIYLCNKTSLYDKFLITSTLTCDFVFLKDEIVKKLYFGTLSAADKKELIEAFAELKKQFVSVVIFPEKNITVFGRADDICQELTDFLMELKLSIKFVTLIGSYFAYPIWAEAPRKAKTKFNNQFNIEYSKIKEMSKQKFNELVNNYMPSSASIYAMKFPLELKPGNLASGIETVLYACPNCGKFFNIYSEFNCIKCKNCGSAIEFQTDGSILLSKNATDFDDLQEFQFDKLYKMEFTKNPIVHYEDINRCISYDGKLEVIGSAEMIIYADKIEVFKNKFKQTIKIKDVLNFEMLGANAICIKLKNDENFYFQGTHKENFYIICNLIEIFG